MSYLTLPDDVPEFSKVVISLWFRVPQESIDKCKAATKDDNTPFDGIIPIICLGPVGSVQEVSLPGEQVAACHTYFQFNEGGQIFSETDLGFTPTKVVVQTPAPAEPMTTEPTCIGIDTRQQRNDPPTLFLRIQTNKPATVERADYALVGVVPATSYAGLGSPGWPPGPNVPAIYTWQDISASSSTEYFAGSNNIIVTADRWHHVLWSFSLADVGTRGAYPDSIWANTSSASRMWLAFDDTNYIESDLSRYWPDESLDPNAIITPRAYEIAGSSPNSGDDLIYDSTDPNNYGVFGANGIPAGTPSFSLAGPTVPKGPVGIPATGQFVDDVLRVEMAEFLMWTGVTLDTGVEANRRLFVTAKNKNGVQFPTNQAPLVVPLSKTAIGDPTTWEGGADVSAFVPGLFDPSGIPSANKLLGIADVDFTKCSFNWMMGRNLGKAKGKVVKTGKIKVYSPDPKLGGQ